MKFRKKKLPRFIQWMIDNYFITIFFACIGFVGVVSFYKLFIKKPTYVYAKVKVSQGLWWASTRKPSVWFVRNIKAGDVEKGLSGKPVSKIISFRYYSWWGSNDYEIYIIMKLKVSKMRNGKYNFKRSAIGVGSPVDFEFPRVQFSGTVIELSNKPINDTYITKTVVLTKKTGYPWEYDAIKIGDKYFDGKETVFRVTKKTSVDTENLTDDVFGNYPGGTEHKKYIVVQADIKVEKTKEGLIFGEEQLIMPGKTINISTSNFKFEGFKVAKVY